jgi:hypothetical protein
LLHCDNSPRCPDELCGGVRLFAIVSATGALDATPAAAIAQHKSTRSEVADPTESTPSMVKSAINPVQRPYPVRGGSSRVNAYLLDLSRVRSSLWRR